MSQPFQIGPDGELPDDVAEKLKGTFIPAKPKRPRYRMSVANSRVFLIVLMGAISLFICSVLPALNRPRSISVSPAVQIEAVMPTMRPSILDRLKSCAGVPASREGFLVIEINLENAASDLVRASLEGEVLCRLTRDNGNNSDPAISPDGKTILYATGDGYTGSLYLMNADGTDAHIVASSGADPAWAPDGTQAVFPIVQVYNADLFVARLDGSFINQRNLTYDDLKYGSYNDLAPAWSPDGKRIAFLSDRDTAALEKNNLEVYVIQPDGKGLRRLTENHTVDLSPAWLPEGRLAFLQLIPDDFGVEIYVMNIDGTGLTQVTDNKGIKTSLAVSRDGRYIYYIMAGTVNRVVMDNNAENIFLADLDAKSLDVWVPQ